MQPPGNGIDTHSFVRGESVNCYKKNRRATDTDGEDSTGPQSVNQNPLLEGVSKSQSSSSRHEGLRCVLSQRMRYLRHKIITVPRRAQQETDERAQRVANLQRNQQNLLRRLEVASRRAVSLVRVHEMERMSRMRANAVRLEILKQANERRARAQCIKEDLQNKRELLRNFLVHEKCREKQQVKQFNEQLLTQIRKQEEESLRERRRMIGGMKQRERIVPLKIRYMMQQKKEKIKAMLCKQAEADENVIEEKRRELDQLAKVEAALARQLAAMNRSKNIYLESGERLPALTNVTENLEQSRQESALAKASASYVI